MSSPNNNIIILILIFILTIQLYCTSNFNNQQYSQTSLIQLNNDVCMKGCLECLNGPNSCTKCSLNNNCCNYACDVCDNKITCLKCKQGFILDKQKNICILQNSCKMEPLCVQCDQNNETCIACQPEYITNKQMKICQKCPAQCIGCFDKNTCFQCKFRFFVKNGNCIPCPSGCSTCENQDKCNNCSDSFYLINETKKCQKCIEKCEKCSSSDNCLSCSGSYYFDADEKLCLECQRPCQKCFQRKNECVSCLEGFYLNLTTSQCVNCEQLFTYCVSCSNNINPSTNISNPICLHCTNKYFFNNVSKKCEPCSLFCIKCNNLTSCNECINEYYLNQTKQCEYCPIINCQMCFNRTVCRFCVAGYFWNQTSTVIYNRCQKCMIGCFSCDQFGCAKCNAGFYAKNSNCYRCDTACQQCLNQSTKCVKCLVGFFKEGVLGKCYKCPEPCSQCTNKTNCTRCIPGYYLHQNICKICSIEKCDQCSKIAENNSSLFFFSNGNVSVTQKCDRCVCGYYRKNLKCEPCNEGCEHCQYQSNYTCMQCFPKYALNPQGNCVKCPENCAHCNIHFDTLSCDNCISGFFFNPSSEICVPCPQYCEYCQHLVCLACKEGYHHENGQTSSYKCLKCQQPCKQCENQNSCLSCMVGFYLTDHFECKKCEKGCQECSSSGCFICNEQYHLNHTTSNCEPCKIEKCSRCSANPSVCDSCVDGYKFYQLKLIESSLVTQEIKTICYRCDEKMEGCKSCDQPDKCKECFNGLQLSENQCIQPDNNASFFIIIGVLSAIIVTVSIFSFYRNYQYRNLLKQKESQLPQNLFESYSINSQNKLDSLRKSMLSQNSD